MTADRDPLPRPARTRRLLLAAPLLAVVALAIAAVVVCALTIGDVSTLDETTDTDLRPLVLPTLVAAVVIAVLVGSSAAASSLVVLAGGVGERRAALRALAAVLGALAALLLVPAVWYGAAHVTSTVDLSLWETGAVGLVVAALGIAGVGAAVYEWYLASVNRASAQLPAGDRAGR